MGRYLLIQHLEMLLGDRLSDVKEDYRARLGCRSRACCSRLPAEGGSRLFLGLAHPSLHVKGGWDAKNAARPEADAPRYRSDLKRPGSACGILIEQERSKWQCWVAGARLSLCWSIPELLNRADQSASFARRRQPAPISSVSCLRSGDPPRLSTKHIFQSSARERPAACRRTHPSCPLFRGDLQLLFSPSRSLFSWGGGGSPSTATKMPLELTQSRVQKIWVPVDHRPSLPRSECSCAGG